MENRKADNETILLLAPLGRDAELAAAALTGEGLHAVGCRDLKDLSERVREQPCGVILLAEEALARDSMPQLAKALADQPPWSDVPVIVLTTGGRATAQSKLALELFGEHANVTLLERPLGVLTLTSTVQVALRARRRQYEVRDLLQERTQVLSSIRDAFVMVDGDWRYTYVNEQACVLCEKTEEELLGRSMWELFPQTLGTPFETHVRQAMRDRSKMSFDYCNEHWESRWFNIRAYPAENGLALLTVEVTTQKRIQSVLDESERRLHLVLDSSQVGMWYCDLPFDTIQWDANCRQHFGIPLDMEVDLETFYALIHEDDREPTRLAIDGAMTGEKRFDVEYRVLLPGGGVRWIHAIGKVFFGDSGEAQRFDGVTIDISGRKETELALERAREEALEANRAKDHFLAALSHELRTPLTPVLMSVAELKRDHGLPDRVREDLEMIHRNVELEARLIDDLLDVTRISRGKLTLHREVVDVHELLERTIQTCCDPEVMKKGLRISFQPEAAEHHVYADAARLQQIFWNLLNNAVKFTPGGGQVTIATSNPKSRVLEIRVKDTGKGIDWKVLPQLFEAFEQGGGSVTRMFGGLGLGLAISKALADLHAARLWAESDGADKGSTFFVCLSAVSQKKEEAKREQTGQLVLAERLKILLVEDHEPTRRILGRLLTRAGHHVEAGGSVAEGLELAENHRFDLLMSDLGLPDGSGIDLMRAVRERYELPGLALSGFGMEDDVRESIDAGFSMHLTKPVDWRRLEEALAAIMVPQQPDDAR